MLRLPETCVLLVGLVLAAAGPALASDRGDLERLIATVSEGIRVEDPGADPARRLDALLGTLRTLGVVVPAELDRRTDLSDGELAATLAGALDGPGAGERRSQLATLAEVFGGVAARVARSESSGTPAGMRPVGIAEVARTVLDQPAKNPWKPVPRSGWSPVPARPAPRSPSSRSPLTEPPVAPPSAVEPAREVGLPEGSMRARAEAGASPELVPAERAAPPRIRTPEAVQEPDRNAARIEALLARRRTVPGPVAVARVPPAAPAPAPAPVKASLTLASLTPPVAPDRKDPPFPRVVVPPAREVTIVTAGAPRLVGAGTHRVPWTSTVEVPNHTLVSLEVPERGTFEIWDDSAAVVNIEGIRMLYGMIRRVGP